MFNHVKIGIAPLTWTNDDLPELGEHIPFEQCIQEMAAAGYAGCEVGNKFPKEADVLLAALSAHQLQVASQWCDIFFTEPGREQETVQLFSEKLMFLKSLGAKTIVVCERGGSIQGKNVAVFGDNKPVFSEVTWQALFEGLKQIGDIATAHDMQIAYHHHMGTGIQDEDEIDHLLSNTDPARINLLFDTGHLVYAGIDPLNIIAKYADRIVHVHLKDLRQGKIDEVKRNNMSFLDSVKAGVFTVPGDGQIDFKPILDELSHNNYQGWMIVEAEQDPKQAHPLTYAKMGREHIYSITGI